MSNNKISCNEYPTTYVKVDHIAIVVSDVSRSSAFYGGKLGMVQVMVRNIENIEHCDQEKSMTWSYHAVYCSFFFCPKMLRPDFDRFGAWFTMGNINLHLINGNNLLELSL